MPEANHLCQGNQECVLKAEVDKLRNEVDRLNELISTDTLTGLHNYRFFCEAIAKEIERSQRTGQPTILIMADADHFKQVNDQWGHEVGNQALRLIAQCINNHIRKLDIPCRYGGEEFAIILPSTAITTAIQVSERIRTTVEQTPLSITLDDKPVSIPLSISLGFSTYHGHAEDSVQKLIERADEELYRAKKEGRNRVCYSPSHDQGHQQIDNDEKSALFDIFNSDDD